MKSMYDQITTNFNTYEGRCRGTNCCGHTSSVSPEVWRALQKLRDIFGPLTLSNGFRCQVHNKSLKKSKATSQHCKGLAVDVYFPEGIDRDEFIRVAKTLFKGVGIYKNFIHLDLREGRRATWRSN